MSFDIHIIGTGSTGNSIVIDNSIMIDCGLSFKKLEQDILKINTLFVTHRHSDHINPSVLSKLIKVRPWVLRESFYCNEDVAEFIKSKNTPKFEYSVPKENIIKEHGDVFNITSGGQEYTIETFKLDHDVPNQGFVITKKVMNDLGKEVEESLVYASDTSTMKYAPKRLYDVIVVEGNYDEDKVFTALESDDKAVQFRAIRNFRHLSVQQFEDFVTAHSKSTTVSYQLHESGTFGVSSNFGQNNI